MTREEVETLFKKVINEFKALKIPISNEIERINVNKRAKRRLGACKIERTPDKKLMYKIEISEIALQCDERDIRGIIAHELLHTCPGCFNHGKKWKQYGDVAEKALGYKISRTIRYEDIGIKEPECTERIKYVIICPECGNRYERKRMCPLVEAPWNYKCGRCGSNLAYKRKSTIYCR